MPLAELYLVQFRVAFGSVVVFGREHILIPINGFPVRPTTTADNVFSPARGPHTQERRTRRKRDNVGARESE